MLALEHKGTLKVRHRKKQIEIKAHPFGGAVRILDLNRLNAVAGNFNFDSEKSQSEGDFRIFIKPISWEGVKDFCISQLKDNADSALELDPGRELVEEFSDALGVQLQPDQYSSKPIGIVLENEPTPTANVHAAGYPTVRIYHVDEVRIQDRDLCKSMMENSENHTSRVLHGIAQDQAKMGGKGRANAMLVVPIEQVRAAILNSPLNTRGEPWLFEGTYMEGNVTALFPDIPVPKYLHISE